MEFSVFDLSKRLGVAPDTIERWIRQGKLPVSKQGSDYRFSKQELQKWADNHNICLNLSEKKIPAKEPGTLIALSTAVQNGGIYFDIPGNDVKTILKASIERIDAIPLDFRKDLFDRLVERENALSTGIGNQIAIPHPRIQLSYLKEPVVAVCFLEKPVDYNALDQQPVTILFFLLCPDLKVHLHLLSSLSFCLRNKEFISFLKSRPDSKDLIEKIQILQNLNTI